MKTRNTFKPLLCLLICSLVGISCADESDIYPEEDYTEYATCASKRKTRMADTPSPKLGDIMAGSETVAIGFFSCTFGWPNVSRHDGNNPNKVPTLSVAIRDGHPEVRIVESSITTKCTGLWNSFSIAYCIQYNYFQMELDSYGRWVSVSDILTDSLKGHHPIPDNYIR